MLFPVCFLDVKKKNKERSTRSHLLLFPFCLLPDDLSLSLSLFRFHIQCGISVEYRLGRWSAPVSSSFVNAPVFLSHRLLLKGWYPFHPCSNWRNRHRMCSHSHPSIHAIPLTIFLLVHQSIHTHRNPFSLSRVFSHAFVMPTPNMERSSWLYISSPRLLGSLVWFFFISTVSTWVSDWRVRKSTVMRLHFLFVGMYLIDGLAHLQIISPERRLAFIRRMNEFSISGLISRLPLLSQDRLDQLKSYWTGERLRLLATALLLYKFITPLRYAFTLGVTTYVSRIFLRRGLIKRAPQGDTLQELYRDQKQLINSHVRRAREKIKTSVRRGRKKIEWTFID